MRPTLVPNISKDVVELSFTTEPSGQLDVFWQDGHSFGVHGANVGVLEEPNKVGFRGLLERTDSLRLKPQVSREVLRNLPDKPLERELPDQQLGGLLVLLNLSEGDGAGSVTVRFLDTTL
jgi:hypothetical protein